MRIRSPVTAAAARWGIRLSGTALINLHRSNAAIVIAYLPKNKSIFIPRTKFAFLKKNAIIILLMPLMGQ